MQIQIFTVMMDALHSTLQHSLVTLTFLRSYLSTVWRLMHRMNTNLPHFSWHHNMDTPMLCSYCLTTMQIQISTVMMEALHSTLQHFMVTLMFLVSYSSAVWRLMHRMNTNLPHFSWHPNMDASMLCSYFSTAMQMWKHVARMARPRCFVPHSGVITKLYRYCWIEMRRSMRGAMTVLLHYT